MCNNKTHIYSDDNIASLDGRIVNLERNLEDVRNSIWIAVLELKKRVSNLENDNKVLETTLEKSLLQNGKDWEEIQLLKKQVNKKPYKNLKEYYEANPEEAKKAMRKLLEIDDRVKKTVKSFNKDELFQK